MSWLDRYFAPGVLGLQLAGVALPTEPYVNLVSGFTAVDNPGQQRIDVVATGGGGGGGGYATIEGAGSAVTQRSVVNFVSGASVIDNPGAARTDITIPTPTYRTTIATSPTLFLCAWLIQPVNTSGAPRTVTADAACQEGYIIQLPDAAAAYGTNALTFNGGGYNVEDPYNPSAAPAATWVSPAGFNRLAPSWILIKNGSGTLFWKGYMAC